MNMWRLIRLVTPEVDTVWASSQNGWHFLNLLAGGLDDNCLGLRNLSNFLPNCIEKFRCKVSAVWPFNRVGVAIDSFLLK